jgi:hypothetical protein
MRYVITPSIGVQGLPFGEPRVAVRRRVGMPFFSFKRASEEPCDHFQQIGLFAYYDDEDRLAALEFARPAEPILNGVDLLRVDFPTAKSLLAAIGAPIVEDSEGVTSYRAGVGLWAPNADEDATAPCECVIAFSKGYYDKA